MPKVTKRPGYHAALRWVIANPRGTTLRMIAALYKKTRDQVTIDLASQAAELNNPVPDNWGKAAMEDPDVY